MPRPRVRDEDRKRVSRACDTCKRRKEKCNGEHPCLLCRRRGRESDCTFSDGSTRRASTQRNSVSTTISPASRQTSKSTTKPPLTNQPVTLNDALEDSKPTNTDAEIAIESLLTLSGGRSAAKTPPGPGESISENGMRGQRQNDDPASRAPVPKLARLLRDGHGKFIFVGDSSNLAFVQNIRRLVKSEIGESPLTSDPLRHAMVEVIPPHKPASIGRPVGKPSLSEVKDLVKQYLLATSGVIDLFDPSEITEHLCAWAQDATTETDFNSSIYFLVLAIGAQVRNGTGEVQAEQYLSHGRELVASSFMDDPSVLTIQAYALITFYMLSACRRNGAFMLLGIAVRAAYALGLHRSDISSLFETRERKTRERVWKSLRVLDLYMSASLGRPPATSEVDGGSISWDGATRDYESILMAGLNASAMLRISFIFERIMNEVYCRREVSVQLVESISRQYRDWTLQLPAGLQTDGLDQTPGSSSPTLQQTIGIAHLKVAYYWSIILLTRPFLIFMVSNKIKGAGGREEREFKQSGNNSVTLTLSEACVDAALRSVEIATDLLHTPGVPKRMFMITNSTFVSAMVIGFAIFGDFDKSFPLLSSIDQAEAILALMAKDDPSARRYEQITSYLRQAANEHIRRRDQQQLQQRRRDIHNIFGDPINKDSDPEQPSPNPTPKGHILIPQEVPETEPTNDSIIDQMQDMSWQLRFDMPAESRGPTLTTSGALAMTGEEGNQPPLDFSRYDFEQNGGMDPFSPDGSGIPSLPSYAEEFPLFSLMTEFDMQDPFQMGIT